MCVDAWLTSWRTFCPVCKRDARTSNGEPTANDSTPLLSSAADSLASSSLLSSFRSSLASSSAIQIGGSSRTPSVSLPQSVSSTPYNPHSLLSRHQSPHLGASRSSVDLQNMSSQRSRGVYLVSPHSLGYPSLSSLNSRYMSPYIPSPGMGSSSYLGSSSRQANPLLYGESATTESRPLHYSGSVTSFYDGSSSHQANPLHYGESATTEARALHYSESATSFSPFTSAHSLPDC